MELKAKVSTISPQSDLMIVISRCNGKGFAGITFEAKQGKPGITVLIPSWLALNRFLIANEYFRQSQKKKSLFFYNGD